MITARNKNQRQFIVELILFPEKNKCEKIQYKIKSQKRVCILVKWCSKANVWSLSMLFSNRLWKSTCKCCERKRNEIPKWCIGLEIIQMVEAWVRELWIVFIAMLAAVLWFSSFKRLSSNCSLASHTHTQRENNIQIIAYFEWFIRSMVNIGVYLKLKTVRSIFIGGLLPQPIASALNHFARMQFNTSKTHRNVHDCRGWNSKWSYHKVNLYRR